MLTSDNKWLQVWWPGTWQEVDVLVKEMVPIIRSTAMWERSWHQCLVFFHSVNMAVVAVTQRKLVKHRVED